MSSTAFAIGQMSRFSSPGFTVIHPDANAYTLATKTGTFADVTSGNAPHTFVDANVSVAGDTVTITGHTLGTANGAGPVQLTTTGTLPGGLSLATNYWIVIVDANTIGFATTPTTAAAGTKINITSAAGGGTHTITLWNPPGTSAFTDASRSSNNITATAHGLGTGDGPVRLVTTGTLPAGLATATDYWIIRVNANTVAFATSAANAYAATAVSITAAASGGEHRINYPITLFAARYTGSQVVTLQTCTIAAHQILGNSIAKHLFFECNIVRSWTANSSGGTALTLTGNAFKTRTADASTGFGRIEVASTAHIAAGTWVKDAYPIGGTGGAFSTTANATIITGVGNPTTGGATGFILASNEGFVVQIANYTPLPGTGSHVFHVTMLWQETPT